MPVLLKLIDPDIFLRQDKNKRKMWCQIRAVEIPGKMVFNGCSQLLWQASGELSSQTLGALVASGWETPQDFFCPHYTCPENTHWKGLSAPSVSRTACPPPAPLCSPAITFLHWDRPHADPPFWQHRQHLWFPWQLQNAKYGAGAHHSITSFPWLLQEVGSTSWSCPQDPGCRTLHGPTQLQGLYFRTTVQEGNSSTLWRST